jgi:RNA polymerase sigma factor (sigma-70 family)
LGGQGDKKKRRSYRPTVEALEALRLLSSALQSRPDLAIPGDVLTDASPQAPLAPGLDQQFTWDQALSQTLLADILRPQTAGASSSASTTSSQTESGLAQLNRYLNRAWYRAGIPVQYHDDCTQAVFVTLLQNLGRDRFDQLVNDVGTSGVREVLSRETPEGPDFFRAVDTVKKRAQRERTYQPIDNLDVAQPSPGEDALALWRSELQEAIDHSLTPREATLIYETLMGKTPSEIATQWGVAPKTISNEKTRVLQKLRTALVADTPE